jgi:hypothetical protein
MIHLSARLAWHDTGWNGCVCRVPHLNAPCIVREQIRDGRDDELERAHAGVPLAGLPGWLLPGFDVEPGTSPLVITSRDGRRQH